MGRDFAESDRVGTEHVAIVNQAFSRRFLDGRNPLGEFITLADFMVEPSPNIPIRIVGVAADSVYISLREPPQPTMYLPFAQHGVAVGQALLRISAGSIRDARLAGTHTAANAATHRTSGAVANVTRS